MLLRIKDLLILLLIFLSAIFVTNIVCRKDILCRMFSFIMLMLFFMLMFFLIHRLQQLSNEINSRIEENAFFKKI